MESAPPRTSPEGKTPAYDPDAEKQTVALMCGRLRLPTDYSQIKIQLRFGERWPAPNLQASWNVSPTEQVLVARHDGVTGERRPDLMRWGILPRWEKEPKTKLATHNAVSEEMDKKALYKGPMDAGEALPRRQRRLL